MDQAIDKNSLHFCAQETKIAEGQVAKVLDLLFNQQCTVPFITRYRKEVTGNLDEVQIRQIQETFETHKETEKRREYILDSLKKMDALTKELEEQVLKASTLTQLEDIYAPYKAKKKTKAMVARENGLEPLALEILNTSKTVQQLESSFTATELVKTFAEALEGASHIILEKMAHHLELKEELRKEYWASALMKSSLRPSGKEIEDYSKFQDFFDFSESVKSLALEKSSHRFLAMRRGLLAKILKVDVEFPEESALSLMRKFFFENEKKLGCLAFIIQCARKAFNQAIHPSLDLEIKTELKRIADEAAIKVFNVNLKNLLLSPYLGAKAVMGVDPGVRTGCKIALIDHTGKFLADFVIYPHEPQRDIVKAKMMIEKALEAFKIEHIAIGNGTYGRETLDFFDTHIEAVKQEKVKATMISEAGASIYSASDIARKEFPDKDPTVRGAISIARRFQDPLAELVKIDPKSIGVGQYQHDVNQQKLKKSLDDVVESCVNYVGVDLNTASAPLLSFISGIGPKVAENVVSYREKVGGLRNRQQLLEIPRFSQKIFEQAAGFLRIYQGENPLDATFIHPERYQTLMDWCQKQKLSLGDLTQVENVERLKKDRELEQTIGALTFKDIVASLKAPSQDPRTAFKSAEFSKKLKSFADVKEGEWYTGVVSNITQFGAFVDIGIKETGLVHVSELADRFVENALDVVSVGQEIQVRVLGIDHARKRLSLSCKKHSQGGQTTMGSGSVGTGKKMQHHEQKVIKNNAFGALKNFKVK